jgi:hypothetical protein
MDKLKHVKNNSKYVTQRVLPCTLREDRHCPCYYTPVAMAKVCYKRVTRAYGRGACHGATISMPIVACVVWQ